MYLKTLQGGAPTLIVYSIAPYEQKQEEPQPQPDYGAQIAELRAQIETLKKSKGGSFNELIQPPTSTNADWPANQSSR